MQKRGGLDANKRTSGCSTRVLALSLLGLWTTLACELGELPREPAEGEQLRAALATANPPQLTMTAGVSDGSQPVGVVATAASQQPISVDSLNGVPTQVQSIDADGNITIPMSATQPAPEPMVNVAVPTSVRAPTTNAEIPELGAQNSPLQAVPIIGGTLSFTSDRQTAVAVDPDRDAVYLVDLEQETLTHTVTLEDGDMPTRSVITPDGVLYVVLRGSAGVAVVNLSEGQLVTRFEVCVEPRGIDYDPERDAIVVSCQGGKLLQLDRGGEIRRSWQLPSDLRDIVVHQGQYLVSRFRLASMLVVDPEGTDYAEYRDETVYPEGPGTLNADGSIPSNPGVFEPRVAWKLHELDEQHVVMHHQRANRGQLVAAYYGSVTPTGCASGVVQAVLTEFHAAQLDSGAETGSALEASSGVTTDPAAGPSFELWHNLPAAQVYDVAFAPDLSRVATFSLGMTDTVVHEGLGAQDTEVSRNCVDPQFAQTKVSGQASAIGYDSQLRIILQLRQPAALQIVGGQRIVLSADDREDSGHRLFHASTDLGVACASCHPEGGEDGVAWSFAGIGLRRTQTLRGGILSTAPLHWVGDRVDFSELMLDTFVTRMGGQEPSPAQAQVLGNWLDGLQAVLSDVDVDQDQLAVGEQAYASAGCARCHSGANTTDNLNHDVGTGGAFQTPSLSGLAARAPYMHDGCAATLEDRFEPACGGDQHGELEALTQAQKAALVSYLLTL